MNHLGHRLKDLRVRSGLTLRELARQADVSPSLVSQIENGKSQPSVATLYAFSRLLNVAVDDLFNADEPPKPVAAHRTSNRSAERADGAGTERRTRVDPIHAWRPSEYANRVSVVHPTHRPHLEMSDGVVWERLAATPEHGVSFMKIAYAPGAASGPHDDPSIHDAYEYGYVLAGKIEITVGDEVFLLHEGESLGFDSTIPHTLRNPGEEPFEGIWFVHGDRH